MIELTDNLSVNPHLITMDLLTISVSDANKPLLKKAIPIMIKALRLRGETVPKMVVDIVKTLLQLTYDPDCMKMMIDNKTELIILLQKLIVPPKYDMDARMSSQNLQNVLSPPPAAAPPAAPPQGSAATKQGGPKLSNFVRNIVTKKNDAAPSDAAARPPSGRRKSSVSRTSSVKHVMLSYNWDIQPIVKRVDELLTSNGIKTWLDM